MQSEQKPNAAFEKVLARIQRAVRRTRWFLDNLIENAIKYSPQGSPVNLTASMEHENLIIEVLDHGPGVPRDDRAMIFDKYTRGRQADEVPGTGMGLYIVKKVVAKHSGEVVLYDRPMGGTCVQITLPLVQNVSAG